MSGYFATLAARATGHAVVLRPLARSPYEGRSEDAGLEEMLRPAALTSPLHQPPGPTGRDMSSPPLAPAPPQGDDAPVASVQAAPTISVTQVFPATASEANQPPQGTAGTPTAAMEAAPRPPFPASGSPATSVSRQPRHPEATPLPPAAREPDAAAMPGPPAAPSFPSTHPERRILHETMQHDEALAPQAPPPRETAATPPITPAPPNVRRAPSSSPIPVPPRTRSAGPARSEPPVVIRIERIDVHAAPPAPAPAPARRGAAPQAPAPGPSLAEFLRSGRPQR